MAEDGYEYLVGIKDEMSGPSRQIQASLDFLTGALYRQNAALRSSAAAHGEASHKLREHEGLLRGFASGLLQGAFGGGGLTTMIAEGTLLAHAVEKAGDLMSDSIKFSIESAEFKENAIAAYTAIKGTAEEGEETFRALDRTARNIHMPTERAHQLAQQLMLEGLESQRSVTETVRAIGELQRVGLTAGADKLQAIVGRSVAAGHLELGKGPKGLKGTGLTFDLIAEQLGMGRKKFEGELKAGRVSTEEGLAAIDRVIVQGKIGALATKRFTITDAFTDLHNTVRKVFQETDVSPLTEAIKRATQSFNDGTDAANGMKGAIDTIVSGVAAVIDTARDIGVTFGQAFEKMKSAANDAFDFLVMHDPRLSQEERQEKLRQIHMGQHMMQQDKLMKQQLDARAQLQEMANAGSSAHDIAKEAKRLGVEVTLVDRPKEGDEKALQKFRAQVTEFSGKSDPRAPLHDMRTAGKQLNKQMHTMGKEAGESMEAGGREGLRAHSPSEKMYDLGLDGARGFESGARAGNAMLARESTKSDARPAGSRDVHVSVDVGGIAFHGHVSGEDLLPLLESQLVDVFERAALELGQ